MYRLTFIVIYNFYSTGTSMDGFVRCGLGRLRKANVQHNYTSLHECGESNYKKCKSGENARCLQDVQNAAVMSYCAPIMDLENPFAWERDALPAAVTVFRHPVHRVWSMFRFQTSRCYSCRNLTDIYADIDAGRADDMSHNCRMQLLNHQTRNMISREAVLENSENPESEEAVLEAIANMRNVFTMIGLTEDMSATEAMAGKVFPWLARDVDWNEAMSGDSSQLLPSDVMCELPHSNGSPRNNRCGEGGGHWDLPSEPDEETTRVILEHNQADLKLYEAAVQHFDLQKRALNL